MMASTDSLPASNSSTIDVNAKILSDLSTLTDQISLCKEMLVEQPENATSMNDALLGVIGFLEACVPRMVELVQVTLGNTTGEISLDEGTVEKCLTLNDELTKVLDLAGEISEKMSKGEPYKELLMAHSSASSLTDTTSSTGGEKKSPDGFDFDLDDLLIDNGPTKMAPMKSPEPDIFAENDAKLPATSNDDTNKTNDDDIFDEFDAFLNERPQFKEG